jgi:acyl-CoA synthetase (AMP-forming)/AMP-acid ligase II
MTILKSGETSEGAIMPTRLIYVARLNAASHGKELAWIDEVAGEQITHEALFERTLIAIEQLKSRKLAPGQIVCLVLTRTGNFLPLLMACIELGLILAPIGEDRQDIQSAIRFLRPRLVLYASELPSRAEIVSSKLEISSIAAFMEEGVTTDDAEIAASARRHELREAPALLIRTSGTTGQAKYVELNERGLAWNAFSLQARFQCSRADRILCTLPWSHMNAIMLTGCLPLVAGATTVYRNITRSADPVTAILKSGASVVSLTPTLISFLLKRKNHAEDLRTLKFVFCGAAPLNSKLWSEGERILRCKIYQGYGLTETTCWVTASIPGRENDYLNIGTAIAGEIRVSASEDFHLITQNGSLATATQKLGEIQVKGPLLMCGYRYPDGRRGAKLTDDGYFRTGDIGYIDEAHNIRIVGRIKEIIIRSGINVVPESVDAVIRQHPSIAECKTVGVPDEFLGERVVTAYVLKGTEDLLDIELRRYARGRLPAKSLPNEFVCVAKLPATAVGKIAIEQLRKLVGGDYARGAFESINTWKFKRAHPLEPERIIQSFQNRILMSQPLRYISYWGVGIKTSVSDSDKKAMHRLRELVDASTVNPNLQGHLKLILTDMHALLNGKPKARVDSYLGEVEKLGHELGFSCVKSSELWKKAGLNILEISRQAESIDLPQVIDSLGVSSDLVNRLANSATRHVEVGSTDDGLKRYLLACQAEREIFAQEYDGSVFLTYNDPDMQFLSPPLPTISISSYNRGTAIKPWFADC